MRKVLVPLLAVALMFGVVTAHAGASGIADPTITVTWKTNTGGKDRAAKELASLESLETAVEDTIDYLDTQAGTASLSNLTVTGTVTLSDTNAVGAVTPAATNSPALVSTTDAQYLKITIGGEVYVITAYQLDD